MVVAHPTPEQLGFQDEASLGDDRLVLFQPLQNFLVLSKPLSKRDHASLIDARSIGDEDHRQLIDLHDGTGRDADPFPDVLVVVVPAVPDGDPLEG